MPFKKYKKYNFFKKYVFTSGELQNKKKMLRLEVTPKMQIAAIKQQTAIYTSFGTSGLTE